MQEEMQRASKYRPKCHGRECIVDSSRKRACSENRSTRRIHYRNSSSRLVAALEGRQRRTTGADGLLPKIPKPPEHFDKSMDTSRQLISVNHALRGSSFWWGDLEKRAVTTSRICRVEHAQQPGSRSSRGHTQQPGSGLAFCQPQERRRPLAGLGQ